MRKIMIIIGMALWTGALVAQAQEEAPRSLRGAQGIDQASVPTKSKAWLEEGTFARNYPQQPPLIPHDISAFTIDRDGNACLTCHNWRADMPGATKIAVSHFLDRQGNALADISPRRYFCTQCHVPQRDAPPLVANTFRAQTSARQTE